jgi:hypothetical protein
VEERFEFDYNDIDRMVAMNDTVEQVIIVMTAEQLEALLEWYCKKFNKIVI